MTSAAATATATATPRFSHRTLVLHLPDPALPAFLGSLTIASGSLIINIGPAPAAPFAIANDSATAIPRPTGPPSATTLSTTAGGNGSAVSLCAKLAKRYQRQVFLSLDMTSLGGSQGGSSVDRVLLPLEKALLVQLDPIVKAL